MKNHHLSHTTKPYETALTAGNDFIMLSHRTSDELMIRLNAKRVTDKICQIRFLEVRCLPEQFTNSHFTPLDGKCIYCYA